MLQANDRKFPGKWFHGYVFCRNWVLQAHKREGVDSMFVQVMILFLTQLSFSTI
jgi:hypothetical protein